MVAFDISRQRRPSGTYIVLENRFPDKYGVVDLSDKAFRHLITAWCRTAGNWTNGWLADDEVRSIFTLSTRREVIRHGHLRQVGDDWFMPGAPEAKRSRGRRAISVTIRESVYDRDGRQCLRCGTTTGLTLDHIHPWSKGGTDTLDNLQTLCQSCNSKKGARIGGR